MSRQQRVMVTPINLLFRHLQSHTRVAVWLHNDSVSSIEGIVVGFDEFMNVVLASASRVVAEPGKPRSETPLGRILLKGDNIVLVAEATSTQNT